MSASDGDLLVRAKAGDVNAFDHLVRPLQDKLLRFVLVLTGDQDDAEDALQEALVRAYLSLKQFRGDASFSTWLHRVALTSTRNWIRSSQRQSTARMLERIEQFRPDAPAPVESQVIAHERSQAIQDAIRALPSHYREVVVLRHYQDMSYEEIAQVLGIPVGTVRSRLSEARQRLLQMLKRSGYFPYLERGGPDELQDGTLSHRDSSRRRQR